MYMHLRKEVTIFSKCLIFSIILTLLMGLVSNATAYGDGPNTSYEKDLYGFPHTWRYYIRGNGWEYDYNWLIINIIEVSFFTYFIVWFIDRNTK